MTRDTLHPLAEDYLRRLRRAGRQLPPDRLGELVAEIEGYLAEAIPPGASDQEALEVIERLGSPSDIVEAERPPAYVPADRRGWREWGAVILLPLGGFAVGVGWLIGVVLVLCARPDRDSRLSGPPRPRQIRLHRHPTRQARTPLARILTARVGSRTLAQQEVERGAVERRHGRPPLATRD